MRRQSFNSSYPAKIKDVHLALLPLDSSVTAPLVITTASLPAGQVGSAYSQTLSATGEISGTPTTPETANFTVEATDSDSPAATDTQALSIIVAAGGAGPTYQVASSDAESTTTSTSWQNKVTLTFTPPAADEWLIFGFAEYRGASTNSSTLVRLVVDGSSEAEVTREANDVTDWLPFVTSKAMTLGASQHTITLDYRSETAVTSGIRRARIVAIRKDALEMAAAAVDSQQLLTSTMTDYATLHWTPSTAGDYLLVWTAELSAMSSYSTSVEARCDGAAWDSGVVESKDNTDYIAMASFAVATCDTAQHSISVAAAREGSGNHYIRRIRLTALRLSDGRFADYAGVSSDATASTSSTTFQEKLKESWNWGNAGDWLLLASARVTENNTGRSVDTRLQMDDTTTLAQQLREPQDTSDWLNFVCVAVENLGLGTRTADIDYRSENSSYTAGIRAARFYALPLE